MKTYTGFNKNTTKYLALDAGAVYVNFDTETDTFENSKHKLLGATSGGNTFEAIPEFRQVEVDGVSGKAKGLSILDFWEVSLTTNLLEFREDVYKYALAASESKDTTIGESEYTEIKAKNYVSDSDYLDNITYVGKVSGSNEPVIIQIFNALNLEGLSVNYVDKDDIVAELKFEGHYDSENLDNPPFVIYTPKVTVDEEPEPEPDPEGGV